MGSANLGTRLKREWNVRGFHCAIALHCVQSKMEMRKNVSKSNTNTRPCTERKREVESQNVLLRETKLVTLIGACSSCWLEIQCHFNDKRRALQIIASHPDMFATRKMFPQIRPIGKLHETNKLRDNNVKINSLVVRIAYVRGAYNVIRLKVWNPHDVSFYSLFITSFFVCL